MKTAHDILRDVASERGLALDAIKSRSRAAALIEARADFVKRCAMTRDLTDGQIGLVIGRTAHTVRYHRVDSFREHKKALNRARHARIRAEVTL